jgi:predicted  nucleic acid-binding Zn-ribbon protein
VTPDESRFSATEVQMIMQMMTDIRAAVAGMDHKLDGMVPRPEFTQHQAVVDRRFEALEARVSEKRADHAALEQKIDGVDSRVDTVSDKVTEAETRVTKQIVAAEKERHEGYRSINTKAWFALITAGLAACGGIIAQAIGS